MDSLQVVVKTMLEENITLDRKKPFIVDFDGITISNDTLNQLDQMGITKIGVCANQYYLFKIKNPIKDLTELGAYTNPLLVDIVLATRDKLKLEIVSLTPDELPEFHNLLKQPQNKRKRDQYIRLMEWFHTQK